MIKISVFILTLGIFARANTLEKLLLSEDSNDHQRAVGMAQRMLGDEEVRRSIQTILGIYGSDTIYTSEGSDYGATLGAHEAQRILVLLLKKKPQYLRGVYRLLVLKSQVTTHTGHVGTINRNSESVIETLLKRIQHQDLARELCIEFPNKIAKFLDSSDIGLRLATLDNFSFALTFSSEKMNVDLKADIEASMLETYKSAINNLPKLTWLPFLEDASQHWFIDYDLMSLDDMRMVYDNLEAYYHELEKQFLARKLTRFEFGYLATSLARSLGSYADSSYEIFKAETKRSLGEIRNKLKELQVDQSFIDSVDQFLLDSQGIKTNLDPYAALEKVVDEILNLSRMKQDIDSFKFRLFTSITAGVKFDSVLEEFNRLYQGLNIESRQELVAHIKERITAPVPDYFKQKFNFCNMLLIKGNIF